MGKTTISFNKIGIVSEILERLNPGIKFFPRNEKTIVLSFKKAGFIKLKVPRDWELEVKSHGVVLLLGGIEESFSYKIIFLPN